MKKITIELESTPETAIEVNQTMTWIMQEGRFRGALQDFSNHLRRKYKHEDPEGTDEQVTGRLAEIYEIREKFWELLEEHDCDLDLI